MITIKTLADLLTASRFALAWILLWLGIVSGAETLPLAVGVLVLAWLTDTLDGPLARRDPSGRHTWIGDRDLETDLSVAVGVLAYLALAGFVWPKLAVAYGIICLALLWHFRSIHLAWVLQAPPYAGMLITALRYARPMGLLAVGYIGLIIVATWPRFPDRVIPQFLEGMRSLRPTPTAELRPPVEEPIGVKNEHDNGQRWQSR